MKHPEKMDREDLVAYIESLKRMIHNLRIQAGLKPRTYSKLVLNHDNLVFFANNLKKDIRDLQAQVYASTTKP